jgi:hypothetical protein
MDNRILVPVRYAAWLSGDLGRRLERSLQAGLDGIGARITRMPRGFLVEAEEDSGPLLEAVHRAVTELEQGVQQEYPVFHHEMGPVWTGTLQVLFPQLAHATPWPSRSTSIMAAPTPT